MGTKAKSKVVKLKSMEFKLSEIWGVQTALSHFMERGDIPFKTAYRFSKMAKDINPEIVDINNARMKLILKYDPDGKKVPDDKLKDFISEFTEFLDSETFVLNHNPIPADDIRNLKMRLDFSTKLAILFTYKSPKVITSKMSYADIVSIDSAIEDFLQLSMPVHLGFDISYTITAIKDKAAEIETERVKIAKKHTSNNAPNVDDDKLSDYQEEMVKYLNETEIDLKYCPINIKLLEDTGIKPATLTGLAPILKE